MTRKIWHRTWSLGPPGSFQRCVNQSRRPVFGKSLPIVEGAGGWPVEEPTRQDLRRFLAYLKKVPPSYFGETRRFDDPDYGDGDQSRRVRAWLQVIDEFDLLADGGEE